MEHNCLEVTDNLHRFLVRRLPKEGFEFFAADLEDTYFEVLFPYASPIRQLNDQRIERMMFHIVPFEDTTRIRIEMKSQTGRMIISPCLGYEHGERIFTTQESVLEECIRCHNSHITCESCIVKIIARDSKCPLCREVMFN
jgi:hypothetical protein